MRSKLGSCLAGLALLLVASCGAGPKKTVDGSCETSADCGGGVCFAEKCYTTCATPAECKPDEFCVVPAAALDLTICMAKSDFAGCQADNDCPSLVGSPCRQTFCDDAVALCDVGSRDVGSDCETAGGHSGACGATGECVCTPNCDGRDCGGDGCGGICGLCTSNATCMEGTCRGACVPDGSPTDACDGKDNDCDGETDEDYAGATTTCGAGACAAQGERVCQNGAEVDTCVPGQAASDDTVCNDVDDDCDGQTDEEYQSTEVTCGDFGCQQTGTTFCEDGQVGSSCTPGTPGSDDTVCNGLDDDCDGPIDEDFVPVATSCGVGACAATGQTACLEGVPVDSCVSGTPAGDDATCDGLDDDCDGQTDEEYLATPTSCGVGVCAANGTVACVAGQLSDTCLPGLPALDDVTCDGLDDDCNGATDDGYAPTEVACGEGACQAFGTTVCEGGLETDSCSPSGPAGDDAVCNAIDDDCDGQTDEDFAATDTTCGVGACAAAGQTSCVEGVEVDSCLAGTPADADASCDGVDDDCNGVADDGVAATPSACGLGVCAAQGQLTCLDGQLSDSCVPGAPLTSDDLTCDGVDDDCDGLVDDDAAPSATTCGTGACAADGLLSCVAGQLVDSCVAGTPGADDTSCNGVDDNCDGQIDEGYVATPTTCGTGACTTSGEMACLGGYVVDTCQAGNGAASDASCDGVDDDCDGQTDEEYIVTATACGVGACAAAGQLSCEGGAAVDSCVAGPPAASDTTCNAVDDDCDGATDEEYVVTITACGVGACIGAGQRTCDGGVQNDSCVAGQPAASDATCDGVDDDCDGQTDEEYVVTSTACGIGACASAGQKTCVGGVVTDSCVAGAPAASDTTCDSTDDDCDGTTDEEYVVTSTACGIGACASAGQKTCVGGVVTDSCVAGTPAASDTTCDGTDDNCNGQTDEAYVPVATVCGVGACQAQGTTTCQGGIAVDSCSPGDGSGSDAVCNGIDDDCNGQTDEDFVPAATACGVGACAAVGATTCVSGVPGDTCVAGTPAASDATCDGVDDNCNGQTDEGYVVTATACGVGACARTGQNTCAGGVVTNSCAPGAPAPSDATCNAVDDNCNGQTDEGYVVTTTSCGVGACVRSGQKTCDAGVVTDSCVPGTPGTADATCNAIDDNCNGQTDEGYVVTSTACGVGACARTGQKTCAAGSEIDSCVAGTPAASDATCNAVDDNCNGQTDEGYVVTTTSCGVGACVRSGQKTCTGGVVTDSCAPGQPGLEVCNGVDDDCNGKTDAADGNGLLANDQPFCERQAGVCLNSKKTAAFCVAGAWNPCNDALYAFWSATYQPNEGPACDGLDNDCNGSTDESYVVTTTSCGVGACVRSGQNTCVGGVVTDSCVPGTPGTTDTTCDAIDDNCNGQTDEGYVVTPTSCGVGACARTGQNTCAGGVVTNSCAPGAPAPSDATCNAVDDDCSGQTDEDYVVTATACGVGACASTGQKTCAGGVVTDSCAPGQPGLEVCNGIDDDCNGKTDASDGNRMLVNDQPLCEVQQGVCLNSKKTAAFCVAGAWKPCTDAIYRYWAPSFQNPELSNCDGLDNDCDAATDEAYLPAATACGTGVCAATGTTFCQGGTVGDTCTPGEPWGSTDYLCDGLDQDCDGLTDETPEADASCGDQVGCTVDACDPLVNQCTNVPDDGLCDDALACSIDTCDVTSGQCLHAADDTACNDSVDCTDDYCYVPTPVTTPVGVPPIRPLSAGGPTEGCNHTLVSTRCDDNDSCTVNTCTTTGCTFPYQGDQTSCDDGDACTYAEICVGGACGGGVGVTCDDSDPCTVDACDPAVGCTAVPLVCDDGIACTVDSCNPDLGGCTAVPTDALCSDGDPCTIDRCYSGEGCSRTPYSCDDGIPCTVDVCDGVGYCTYDLDHPWCETNDPANPVCAYDMGCMPCDDTDGLLWDGCTSWSLSEAALHTLTDLNEKKPDVTVLPDGGFAVAWERSDGQGLVSQIKLRAFKADGSETMAETLVNVSSSNSVVGPRVVARDGTSNLLLSWVRYTGAAAVITDYLMRPFTGASGGTELPIAGGSTQAAPLDWDAASAPRAGSNVQVWSYTDYTSGISGVRAKLFDPAGAPATGVIEVVPNTSSALHSRPRVAQWDDGGFVVVWEDVNGTYGAGTSVVARVFTPTGVPTTDVVVVDEPQWMGERRQPDVAVINGAASDAFVVAWQRSDPFRAQLYGISAAQYSRDGARVGAIVGVQPDGQMLTQTPVVAADATGAIAIAWDMGHIYAATYRQSTAVPPAEPTPLSPAAQVNVHIYGSMSNPAIAKFADGGYIIVWDSCPGETTQDQQIGGSGCGVYGRKYAYDGVPVWLPVLRPIPPNP